MAHGPVGLALHALLGTLLVALARCGDILVASVLLSTILFRRRTS